MQCIDGVNFYLNIHNPLSELTIHGNSYMV